jgi:hypothetical protein
LWENGTNLLIRSVYDIGVGFGIASGVDYPDSLGERFASEILGQPLSNQLHPVNFTAQLLFAYPQQGPALLSAVLLSLCGIEADPAVAQFNVSVIFGTVMGEETVSYTIYDN